MFVGSVQIISRLGSQSKFQMFTLFSGRHVGGAKSSTNMVTWRLHTGLCKFASKMHPSRYVRGVHFIISIKSLRCLYSNGLPLYLSTRIHAYTRFFPLEFLDPFTRCLAFFNHGLPLPLSKRVHCLGIRSFSSSKCLKRSRTDLPSFELCIRMRVRCVVRPHSLRIICAVF